MNPVSLFGAIIAIAEYVKGNSFAANALVSLSGTADFAMVMINLTDLFPFRDFTKATLDAMVSTVRLAGFDSA